MEPKVILEQAKQQIKGKYLKYVGILLFCTILMSVLNTGIPVSILVDHPIWYLPYLIVMFLLIIFRNTIYFLFIKCVRKEVFQKKDIQYTFAKAGLHIITAILFEVIQMGILMIIQLFGSVLPIMILPLVILMQVVLSSVSVFIAFAIYDGVKGSLHIVNGSFRLMKAFFKPLFLMSLPFMIWLLLYQLGTNFLTFQMSADVTKTMSEILQAAISNDATALYAYEWIALSIVNMIVSSFLLVPLYTAFAYVYDHNYLQYYPFQAQIHTNVIDIDQP